MVWQNTYECLYLATSEQITPRVEDTRLESSKDALHKLAQLPTTVTLQMYKVQLVFNTLHYMYICTCIFYDIITDTTVFVI